MRRHENIILTGFMGVGKTTVVVALSNLFGYQALDLDALIEKRTGCTIPQLFEQFGEEGFRQRETEALRGLEGISGTVIATGGGIVTQAANWPLMRRLGVIVYLSASEKTLFRRIGDGAGRPLATSGREKLHKLLESRLSKYENADLIIDTDGLSPEEVARKIMQQLEQR